MHQGWVRALIAVATVLVFVASLTTWVKRQALDTDNWVAASDELLDDPVIQGALATYIVDELYRNVDVQGELEARLPEELQGLAGPASAALREPATQAVRALLDTSRVQALWSTANREAHSLLVRLLEDEGTVVSTGGGEVTLQLGELVRQLGEQLGLPGAVLDRLPPDAGEVVLADSSQLSLAQRTVDAVQVLSVWLFVLVVGLYGLAVYLARDRRRRVVRDIGWALLATSLLLLLVRRVVVAYALSMIETATLERPAQQVVLVGTELLAQLAWAGVLYGLLLVAGAVYAGPTRTATTVRRWTAPLFSPDPAVVWAGATAVFLLVALWSPTPAFEAWWSLILLFALWMGGIEALRRQSRQEFRGATSNDVAALLRRSLSSARLGWTARRTPAGGPPQPDGASPIVAPPGDGAAPDLAAQLQQLAELHRSGALDDEEYRRAKSRVLGAGAPVTT